MVTIDDNIEQIKSLTERMDITIRRLDELYPYRLDHHLRLLKLEENNDQAKNGTARDSNTSAPQG